MLVLEADQLILPRKEHATALFVELIFINHLLCASGPGSLPDTGDGKQTECLLFGAPH